jgi:hypothetical protein
LSQQPDSREKFGNPGLGAAIGVEKPAIGRNCKKIVRHPDRENAGKLHRSQPET